MLFKVLLANPGIRFHRAAAKMWGKKMLARHREFFDLIPNGNGEDLQPDFREPCKDRNVIQCLLV